MTDSEINIAIAEACGWKWYLLPNEHEYRALFLPSLHEYEGQSEEWLKRAEGHEKLANMDFMHLEGHVPKYVNDLNAMHAAEATLVAMDWLRYYLALCEVVGITEGVEWTTEYDILLLRATARQRAEAFLKTIGKWERKMIYTSDGDAAEVLP